MIPIFDDTGARLPIIFNTDLRLNEAIGGNPLHIYEVNGIYIRDVFAGTIENRPVGDGSEVYGARKAAKIVRIDGIIRAPTFAQLSDMNAALRGDLDPAALSQADTLGHGFAPLEFTVLSEAGNQESYVLARPVQTPDYMFDQYLGKNVPFRLEFFCADPRRYLLTTDVHTLVGSTTQVVTNDGNYPSIPQIEITMSGAGSASYSFRNTLYNPDGTVGLNLSSTINGDVIVIYPHEKIVTKNGSRADNLVIDGSTWELLIQPGAQTLQTLNGTNASAEVTVFHAYSM